jgi:hypothetical protein
MPMPEQHKESTVRTTETTVKKDGDVQTHSEETKSSGDGTVHHSEKDGEAEPDDGGANASMPPGGTYS